MPTFLSGLNSRFLAKNGNITSARIKERQVKTNALVVPYESITYNKNIHNATKEKCLTTLKRNNTRLYSMRSIWLKKPVARPRRVL
jgi:hypothetical protein